MKSVGLFVFLACFAGLYALQLKCAHQELDIPHDWVDMEKQCIKKMRAQIQEELKASMQYMAMAAHFSKDIVNRPGFAELFFNAASEEREHSIKLIHYLLMRGELTSNVSNLIKRHIIPPVTTWQNGISALKQALQLEASVTRKIRDVIKVCEESSAFNDYHLVDYLASDFLGEQYRGQRDLAGKVSDLQKMMGEHGALGEWLFDKKLQDKAIV